MTGTRRTTVSTDNANTNARHDIPGASARTVAQPKTNHIVAASRKPMSSAEASCSRNVSERRRLFSAMPQTNADTNPLPPIPTLSP
jgi:hypothetical protein